MDPQELFKAATYNFTEIVQQIFIRFLQTDNNGYSRTEVDLKANSDSIKEKRHRSFGRCYTFHPETTRQFGVYYIKAVL